MNTIQIPVKTMTSFELFKLVNDARLQAGQSKIRVNDFTTRIADELDGDDYETFVVINPNKTETRAFRLTIDQCTLVGMRESKVVRRSILEKLKSIESALSLPRSFSEALQLAADQAKQLELQAPKVEFYEKVLATENGITTTEVASELGTSAIALNRTLQDMGVQRRIGKRWVLCASQAGFGYTVETTHVDDGGKSRHGMKWTERGRKFIHDLVGKTAKTELKVVK